MTCRMHASGDVRYAGPYSRRIGRGTACVLFSISIGALASKQRGIGIRPSHFKARSTAAQKRHGAGYVSRCRATIIHGEPRGCVYGMTF